MYDNEPINPNLPLQNRVAIEASRDIFKKLNNLGGDGFEWAHNSKQFLPANVCCDVVGHARFMKLLREAIIEACEKQGIKG